MAYSEKHRALIEDARDALLDLFDEFEPDAWTSLRIGYGELRRALEWDDREAQADQAERDWEAEERLDPDRQELEAAWWHSKQARDAWRTLDAAVKRAWIVDALGDHGLLRHEIAERVTELHPGVEVSYSGVSATLKDLLTAGEIEREREPRTPNCSTTAKSGWRWRWRRRQGVLSPELRDLEQQLREA